MQQTLARYRQRVRAGEVNPMVRWDGKTSGSIFDPARDDVPLTMLGFGAACLDSGPLSLETKDREFIFVPVCGEFEARIGPEVFRAKRAEGPFAGLPETSNASALYCPASANVSIQGKGEIVYFSAPAKGHKPPVLVQPGERETFSRGTSLWMRRVVTLFTPDDVTTVLIGGETYSPPGLWSGTPLHIHDREDPAQNQSDHEEVYYHLLRGAPGPWGPFGVQLLFDDQGLDNAYMIHHRSAFAIPGAAHPVIAGPNSEHLYIWALAGTTPQLKMLDVPEFAYLKKVEAILNELMASHPRKSVSHSDVDRLASQNGLNADQKRVLQLHLQHQGIHVA